MPGLKVKNSSSRGVYRHRKHRLAKSDADGHYGQRSMITNSEEEIHISVASIAFAEQYSQLKTVHDVFEYGCNISKFLACIGTRNSTDRSYNWLTYTEVNDKLRAFGSSLHKLVGWKPDSDYIIASYGRNSPAWLIAQLACAAYSYVFLPLCEALDMGTLNLILKQTQPRVILCYSAKEAESVVRCQSLSICLIIVRESEDADRLRGEYADRVKMFYFEEFLRQGTSNFQPETLPKSDDLAMLCYTSGNTGIPKGVRVTHQQMIDSVKAAVTLLNSKIITREAVHLSCLPLALMLEQLITCVIFLKGGRVAFLTGDLETISVDAKVVKPTIMLFVPAQLTRFYVDYYKNVPKTPCVRNLLEHSITHINNEQARGTFKYTTVPSHLFFRKFRANFGGNVEAVICTGAPLNAQLVPFICAVFCCPVAQIYGTTETMGLVSDIISPEIASHNAIASGIQVKLSDRPDLGLLVTREKIGEILVRGPRCTEGYYKDVDSTRKLFEDEGWQHTGDLGQWASNGTLIVLDRCANAVKLNPDEYLWFDKVQSIYQCCPLVCYVYVDRSHSRLFNIAFVHPDFSVLRAELFNPNVKKRPSSTQSVLSDQTNEALCLDIHVRKFVLKRLNTLGKKRGLKGFEMAGSIYLCPNPFTCENGLLTPLLQVVRHRARIIFHDVIQTLSREGELIV